MRNVFRGFLGLMLTSTLSVSAQTDTIKICTNRSIDSEITFKTVAGVGDAKVFIDWGDGVFAEVTPTGSQVFASLAGTVKGKNIKVVLSDSHYVFDCSNCGVTNIDFTGVQNLRSLYCQNNELKELSLKNMANLIDLDCSNNQIKKLNLTDEQHMEADLKSINMLDLSNNKISGKFSMNSTTLQNLNISYNDFTAFTLNAPILRNLNISNNKIESDLTINSPSLYTVICHNNNIPTINIEDNVQLLTQFICDDNQLKEINLKSTNELLDLSCSNNKLNQIIINDSLKLNSLNANENNLTFSSLPAFEFAPKKISISSQNPFIITDYPGILIKEGVPYAPLASNWNDRYTTFIDISSACKLATGKFDASCEWYAVDANDNETKMIACTSSADGDYFYENGKVAFFRPVKKAFVRLTSGSYNFSIESQHIAISDDISSIDDNTLEQALKIAKVENGVILSSAEAMPVSIYSVMGAIVWKGIVNGSVSVNLPHGLYIINNNKIIL